MQQGRTLPLASATALRWRIGQCLELLRITLARGLGHEQGLGCSATINYAAFEHASRPQALEQRQTALNGLRVLNKHDAGTDAMAAEADEAAAGA